MVLRNSAFTSVNGLWISVFCSDDRSGAVVQEKIIAATECQSVMGNRKPNCIIIDEIDGATGNGDASFIKILVDLVTVNDTRKSSAAAAATPFTNDFLRNPIDKKKKARRMALRRPIICICNNLYFD